MGSIVAVGSGVGAIVPVGVGVGSTVDVGSGTGVAVGGDTVSVGVGCGVLVGLGSGSGFGVTLRSGVAVGNGVGSIVDVGVGFGIPSPTIPKVNVSPSIIGLLLSLLTEVRNSHFPLPELYVARNDVIFWVELPWLFPMDDPLIENDISSSTPLK